MITDREQPLWPAIVSVIAALMLSIVPLPDWLDTWRPDWVALTIVFWSLALPRRISLGSAWVVGLALDTLKGALLGQHALALTLVSYFVVKFHLRMRVFPLGQQTISVGLLILIYEFILFWIDGVVGYPNMSIARFAPVLSSAAIWPLWLILLTSIQKRQFAA